MPTGTLEEFAPSLYSVDGPTVTFFGFAYPTRMAVARLSDGGTWVWSPVALSEELATAVAAIGPVHHIVSPNKLHHLFIEEWHARWPDARLHAPPGLSRKKPAIPFDAELGDAPDVGWAADIDQVIFRGSFAMEEVAFFHRASRTAIVGDLIQRHPESAATGWKGTVMRLDGLVGEHGSAPREWRATFLRRRQARAARASVLGWSAELLLIAHGQCAHSGASQILAEALAWI
jgi:Domain of unknown function (DUF4336)